ncbi:hypothetical protein Cfor_05068 [Coptotermes formosanus]|jgi:hypothetical protein|uniref:Uncharacterized protein n=1 Tax=Coptotermes formosanus TaxID=36987 RepID=A0A6L2PHH8_COPFO|nr:hypothetical protein Cfor_05068 [Coptotermes formosanus]
MQLGYRKVCAGWVSNNFMDDHEAHRLGLPLMRLTYATHGEQFLEYIVTGDETSVNYMTFKTNITSLMWKQPSYPTEMQFRAMLLVRKSEQQKILN